MATPDPASILEHPSQDELFKGVPENVKDYCLKQWDKGVFSLELLNLSITPPTLNIYDDVRSGQLNSGVASRLLRKLESDVENVFDELGHQLALTETFSYNLSTTPPTSNIYDGVVSGHLKIPSGQIKEGTYSGTQLAITEMFNRIERSYESYFDVLAIEPTLPRQIDLEKRKTMYKWSDGTDGYPPHLDFIPKDDKTWLLDIFNTLGLVQSGILIKMIIPSKYGFITDKQFQSVSEEIGIFGEPYKGVTIAEVEERNRFERKSGTDIMRGANIGDLNDWYSDARFAQQQFTGTNPNTITLASTEWLSKFAYTAARQNNEGVVKLFESAQSEVFYIQDCSYFREAAQVGADELMVDENRHLCAAVSLFQLHSDGRLHPLAIIIDYRGSIENSVTIFNQRLSPSDPTGSEEKDWPWRYAKTCAQVSDWIRHEVTVHLVNTHMVEEVIIVATNRHMDSFHPVYRLLQPHWIRTLSLNAAARASLVPHVIFELVGITSTQAKSFIDHAYKSFNFVGGYVPNDLPRRGFPLDKLDTEKFKNYAYARNISLMWNVLRKFVASMLAIEYKSDMKVATDDQIQNWCKEIQIAGKLSSFPTIKTVDQLIDAVTMCIHIASPQHTAVNYLQNFYMAFVIAKPPSLWSEPPRKLADLLSYTEQKLVSALPINKQREWLLAAQIPWLLSFRVADEHNLINYAISVWRLYKEKKEANEKATKAIAEEFYNGLRDLIDKFVIHSKQMTEGTIPYMVMDPNSTAVSILI